MRLLERRAQALDGDVRVDLRGGQARVAEDLLHRAQVGPALQHVRGRRVPQPVRADVGGARHLADESMDDLANRARIDAMASGAEEECVAG